MILRSSLTRQRHALLSAASSPCRAPRSSPKSSLLQTRSAHAVPSLGRHDQGFAQNGVGELFTPAAFKTAWTDYQDHLVSRLNTVLEDDPAKKNMDVRTLLQNVARQPSLAHMFNYASMAHNNFFFFRGLSPTKTEMPKDMTEHVINSFSSVDTLRSSMITTAASMFGPGFVWLVQVEQPSITHPALASGAGHTIGIDPSALHFRILSTYLAGSPYPQAHVRQQSRDMNTQNLQSVEEYARQNTPQNSVGSFGNLSSGALGMASLGDDRSKTLRDITRFGGAETLPVLCVNTWEHCYLQDFGVAGKQEYLEKWWDSIDWNAVWSLCLKKERFKIPR